MSAIPPSGFTVTAKGSLRELVTKCGIIAAFPGEVPPPGHPPYGEFDAVWDTGATSSVISQRIVDHCQLKPISMAQVHTANGSCLSEVYLVNIRLPNGVGFRNVRVTNQRLLGHPVLIGMDIICQGDFAVTNLGYQTKFSFRFPPLRHIDFVADIRAGLPAKVGRNDPCPCGSGKKYKRCHGQAKS